MKKSFLFLCIAASVLHCGKTSTGLSNHSGAQIQVWARVVKQTAGLAKILQTSATTWDSLVVRVTSEAADIDTIIKAFKFATADSSINCSIPDVPAGKARVVEAWTKTSGGLIIHSCASKKVDISSGEIKYIEFDLTPKRGSIYVNCGSLPTTIDHICAAFVFSISNLSDTLSACEARATKTYLSIDNVPDSAAGTLFVMGVGSAGDTLYRSSMPLVFYAYQNATYSAQVPKVTTGLTLGITAQQTGETVVSVSLGAKKPFDVEKGPLIISEIMYNANDSEYIEVYNPLAKDTAFDTLILDIDGVYRYFTNIQIKSKGFFVFGRKPLPWVNATHPVASALDLSSTGNWITVRAKDSSAMDWVAFIGGSNDQGWPNLGSSKKSIVLDSLVSDPSYNNYGPNWAPAKTPINQVDPKYILPATLQCGTPGFPGS